MRSIVFVSERHVNKPRVIGTAVLLATALFVMMTAAPPPVLADPGCATANVLAGSNFEIDVNANLKVDGASPCIDWLAGGTGSALRAGVLAKNDKPSGSNDDAFGMGTSEDDANPTIVDGSIPPNKSDLKVFGVYSEVGTSTVDNPTGKFLELFWSRVQNPSGTTNMDFELNQKFCSGSTSDPNCADNSVPTPETPVRTAGDKLISYDLSQGGTVPTISIRTWDGSSWGLPTVITGGTQPRAIGSVNTSTIGSSDTGGLGSQDPFTFGEAAISISALFPSGTCGTFGSAYLKSRASDSFSTEIKDFVAPEQVRISSCETSISTTLSASTITVGQSVTDSATLTGATSDAGGTVTYSVFANNTCTGTPVASGGTKTVTNGVVPNSDSVTFNSAGTFSWQASYSGDANNLPAKSACTSEQLIVNKKQPSIGTTLSASTITIGQSVTDSATLSGATSNAGGTVTYSVFNNNTCTGSAVASGGTKTVTNGVVPNSDSVTFNSAGTFYWQASYSGDANNLPAKSTCTSEQLIVNKKQPSVSTTLSTSGIIVGQSAHDSATLTGATSNAGGTVTYTVYSDNRCTLNPVAAGTKTVTNGVVPDSNAVTFNSAGTFYWQASYSGDANNRPAKSACTSEQLTVQAKPTISTTLSANPISVGQSIHDSATLTGATSNAGGTVTYTVYSDNQCTLNPVAAGTKTVTNGVVPDSDTVTFGSAGTFYWQASYSGDANNLPVKSACTSEQLKVFGSCVLGYPSGQAPALSSVVFNESEVLRASAAVPGGGSVAGPNDQIAVWYNDEHALTLGVGRVIVKTSSGTTTTDYPITPLNADPTTHAGSATNPQVGTTSLGTGLFFPNSAGHNPQGFPNDQAGTDVVTWNTTYFFLDSGRPMWPALFITDITSNPSSRSGDWQQGGPAASPPSAIFGTWKGAVRTVDKTHTPYAITVTPDSDPAKNNWNLASGDPAPTGLKNEGYGAEARWNVSGLGLQAGHAYRLQFMVHDGDQNKTGGDSGEGCMNVVIPG